MFFSLEIIVIRMKQSVHIKKTTDEKFLVELIGKNSGLFVYETIDKVIECIKKAYQ